MGVFFALAFLILIFLVGVGPLVGGIIGLCAIRKKEMRRKGLAVGLLVTLLVFGALLTLLPVGFVGFVLLSNFRMDTSVVETGVAIEEPGYPGETFTADGVVYKMLPVCFDFEYCQDHSEPAFTYTWEDILGNDVPGNLFRVENPQNLDLIWDGCDLLYCPADQIVPFMTYYSTMGDVQWTCFNTALIESDIWDSVEVSEPYVESIQALPELWCSAEEDVEIPGNALELWITGMIDDDFILDMSFTVTLTETEAYLVRREETVVNANDNGIVKYGIPLSDELFSAFNALTTAQN